MKNQDAIVKQTPAEISEEVLTIHVATSVNDVTQIQQLRYKIYVEEMGRELTDAQHEKKILTDELDRWGILVCAKIGSEVIGSVRINIGKAKQFSEELRKTLCMDTFQLFCHSKYPIGFASKYVVNQAYRSTQAGYLLLRYVDQICREHQVQFNLAGCNPYLISFYERTGYRRFANSFHVPEYGTMVPLVWIIEDIYHLKAVRSPFFRHAYKLKNDRSAAVWFLENFPQATAFINSRLVGEEELWGIATNKLGQSPEKAISLLSGLSQKEAQQFMSLGVIHRFYKRDCLIAMGERSREINILLCGHLSVNSSRNSERTGREEVGAGQYFGEVPIVEMQEQTDTIVAITDGEYWVLSRAAFVKYQQQHPVMGERILKNRNAK